MIHAGGWLARDGGWAAEQFLILRSGYDGGPAGGPVAGVPQARGCFLPCRRSGLLVVRVGVAGR